ncbi:glutamate racemase [Thermus scotoductus]|uniref:Glutamate racemase n=1 Tax=Thermus scotoductus TaxID=37636 RepID=A0A430RDT6_THESC|nr:glutamate racemase [Thermus scotoductus]RTH05570.1 glutamate racemase [Thermus scotoductus]
MKDPRRPIGVFDSGVGGLTVLSALRRALPQEDFFYFGDTARVPYGSKPLSMVRRFAWEIAGFLLRQGVKAIVVACNTASSAALPDLAEDLSVPVFGVLEPVAKAARGYGKVGLIGTQATVESRAYERYVEVSWAKACPLFVPLVEEGLWDDPVALLVARHYLEDAPQDLEALILGCTHYPFLKGTLARVLPGVRLLDSAEATAEEVARTLRREGLLNPEGQGRVVHLVTGDPESYRNLAERLGVRVEELKQVSLEEL